ncbi:MAG: AMIN domain-containing protein, partial [Byssovorax sp.]
MASALLLFAAEARAEGAAPTPAAKAATGAATGKGPAAAPRPKVASKPAQRGQQQTKRVQAALASNMPIATLPAFRLLDDGSTRITVEVSRKVAVTEHKAQGRVVYSLAGVAVPGNNTRLPLPTGFFRTPVGRVEMVEQGGGSDLVIELREAVAPTYRVLDTPRGIVIQVDFQRPAGSSAAPSAEGASRTSETRRIESKATT